MPARDALRTKRWGLVAVFLGLIVLIGLVWAKMDGGDRLLATIAVISAGLLIAGELGKLSGKKVVY